MDSNELADWLHQTLEQLGIPASSFSVAMTSRYAFERDRTDYRVLLTFKLFKTPPFNTLRHVEGRLHAHLERSSAPGTVEIFARESGAGAGSDDPAGRARKRGSVTIASEGDEGDPIWSDTERGGLN